MHYGCILTLQCSVVCDVANGQQSVRKSDMDGRGRLNKSHKCIAEDIP